MDICKAASEGLRSEMKEELLEYYSGASKKSSSTGSGPFQTPPAPPADPAVTTRSPPAQATTTQPTSPLQPSSGTQQPLERQTQEKRTRKVPKPPATGKQKRLGHYISLKKPPSNARKCTIVDDVIYDEEKAPVPVAEPVTQVVPQTPIVLPGPHGGDKKMLNRGTRDILAEITDRLNVDAPGGREPNYDALKSGDEAARDAVVTDIQSGCSGWVSNASAADGSEPSPERDEMDIALAKELLDGFEGTDAVLEGNLLDRTLGEFSTNAWGPIQEPDVYAELQTPYVPVEGASSYPGLCQGYSGPTPEVLHRGDSPMALFVYFMPVALWQHVAVCSNHYQIDALHARVDDAYKRHKRRCQANPTTKKKTRRDVLQELQAVSPIKPHELCRFVGLLIARAIYPNR
ncbi:hypothetical protein DVH05_023902 [Phytophthora capsici]|nr:hypothetical protein DVH05_023902 [Phytophthora capsici]